MFRSFVERSVSIFRVTDSGTSGWRSGWEERNVSVTWEALPVSTSPVGS